MTVTIGQSALAKVNIVISQGADNIYQFRWSTTDDAGVKTPVDLTGYTARAQIRAKVGGAIWLALASPDEIALGADGTVTVSIQDTVTEATAWNSYKSGVWDLELINGDFVTRFVEGSVSVSPDVTRLS